MLSSKKLNELCLGHSQHEGQKIELYRCHLLILFVKIKKVVFASRVLLLGAESSKSARVRDWLILFRLVGELDWQMECWEWIIMQGSISLTVVYNINSRWHRRKTWLEYDINISRSIPVTITRYLLRDWIIVCSCPRVQSLTANKRFEKKYIWE